jgi:hypothetical protein
MPEFPPRPHNWRQPGSSRHKFKIDPEVRRYWDALLEQEREWDRSDPEDVLHIARAVAFGAWVNEDPGHVSDVLFAMSYGRSGETAFWLDVAEVARRLYEEWDEAGEITDEVAARVVYGTDA